MSSPKSRCSQALQSLHMAREPGAAWGLRSDVVSTLRSNPAYWRLKRTIKESVLYDAAQDESTDVDHGESAWCTRLRDWRGNAVLGARLDEHDRWPRLLFSPYTRSMRTLFVHGCAALNLRVTWLAGHVVVQTTHSADGMQSKHNLGAMHATSPDSNHLAHHFVSTTHTHSPL